MMNATNTVGIPKIREMRNDRPHLNKGRRSRKRRRNMKRMRRRRRRRRRRKRGIGDG